MVDEKRKVISVVRALLISDSSGRALSVNELNEQHCLYEGKSIPTFGNRNVEEFLRASGDFDFVNANGVCLVREKARSNSFHIKKLVAEQKRQKKPKNKSIYSLFLPGYRHLRSVRTSLRSDCNSTYNLESSHNSGGLTVPVPYHQNNPTISFTFEELERSSYSKSTYNLKLFHGNKFFGYGSELNMAKNDGSSSVLKKKESYTDQHSNKLSSSDCSSSVETEIKRNNNYETNNLSVNITNQANERSSFEKLKQMRKGLQYKCLQNSIGYSSTVEVDGFEYTGGICDTGVAANNDVAKFVLESAASITKHYSELSSFWKLKLMRKGVHYRCVQDSIGYSSTVVVDGFKYKGDTCDTAASANNDVATLVLENLEIRLNNNNYEAEEIAIDKITTAFARMSI